MCRNPDFGVYSTVFLCACLWAWIYYSVCVCMCVSQRSFGSVIHLNILLIHRTFIALTLDKVNL